MTDLNKCFCKTKGGETILWDKDRIPVYGIDGQRACLDIRISPEQGYVGLPIFYCPYCGRRLDTEE